MSQQMIDEGFVHAALSGMAIGANNLFELFAI